MNRRGLVLSALFVSLTVALGYLLAGIPNVEMMSLCVFLGGVFTGARRGALIGGLSAAIFAFFNPYGASQPPLILSQAAGFALMGAAGGILRGKILGDGYMAVVISALSGFFMTLLYDTMTTAALAYVILGPEGFAGGVAGFFGAGLVFILVHVTVNTIIFSQAVVPIVKVASYEDASG